MIWKPTFQRSCHLSIVDSYTSQIMLVTMKFQQATGILLRKCRKIQIRNLLICILEQKTSRSFTWNKHIQNWDISKKFKGYLLFHLVQLAFGVKLVKKILFWMQPLQNIGNWTNKIKALPILLFITKPLVYFSLIHSGKVSEGYKLVQMI